MDVPRFDRGSTGYVSMLIELSDLSLYLLSYTALDVIGIFLELLPTILDKSLIEGEGPYESPQSSRYSIELAIVVLI
jgi:hypothetical protein